MPSASTSRLMQQPGSGPKTTCGTRLERGRYVAGRALLCFEDFAESGGVLSPSPPRAQGGDKRGPLLPVITSGSEGVADRSADPGLAEAWTLCVASRAARESPALRSSPVGWYVVRSPITPSLKSESRLIAGRPLGVR